MATKHPRLNVTLSPQHMGMLTVLAEKEQKSLSAVALDLIEKALELQEDLHFSQVAKERDNSKTRWVSHADAWKS